MNTSATNTDFRRNLEKQIAQFAADQATRFPATETLKIDLHCHDRNSDIPDERLGRLLRVPETWVSPQKLMAVLQEGETNAWTITNHNNARSCYTLLDQGLDVLVGAEFTCRFNDMECNLHVLTYGFTPKQEVHLNRLRGDLRRFLDYTNDHDIVTVLAHPLFDYAAPSRMPLFLLEKLTLMFERFEAINGQRDTWQNLMMIRWLESLDRTKIDDIARRHAIRPDRYCKQPYRKYMTGGSDCHMALFVGKTGVRAHVPDLEEKMKHTSRADLVLEALRNGRVAPYGKYTALEKMTASFLDYFCQATFHMKDPGLFRLLLHRGSPQEKLGALAITNALMELRRHRYTKRFLQTFYNALHGKKPGRFLRLTIAKPLRPVVRELEAIAEARTHTPQHFEAQLTESLPRISKTFSQLLGQKVEHSFSRLLHTTRHGGPAQTARSISEIIAQLELPSHMRALITNRTTAADKPMSQTNVAKLIDDLSFPVLATGILGGAAFGAAKIQFSCRDILTECANNLQTLSPPKRALWLCGPLTGHGFIPRLNRQMLRIIGLRDLPIDLVVCTHRTTMHLSDPDLEVHRSHVRFLEAVGSLPLWFSPETQVKLFDFLDLQRLFLEGGYDRIICTEDLPLGIYARLLQLCFSVPAYTMVINDPFRLLRHRGRPNDAIHDRVRRILRAYYRDFDGIFVLTAKQKGGLLDRSMGLDPQKTHVTLPLLSPLDAYFDEVPELENQPSSEFTNFLSAAIDGDYIPHPTQKEWQITPGSRHVGGMLSIIMEKTGLAADTIQRSHESREPKIATKRQKSSFI